MYRNFFGFTRAPFPQDIPVADLYQLPGLLSVNERFKFTVDCGAVGVITGDVGAGKSTSLRHACAQFHPSKYHIISTTALNGTFLEILRKITIGLSLQLNSNSPTIMMKHIHTAIMEITAKKQVPVLVIDEAHLIRIEVFAQLHTLIQFNFDSKPLIPVILCGQNNLIDCLSYHSSRPLASRIVGRSYLEAINLDAMKGYVQHHLSIAGLKNNVFSEPALLAIHQGSGGFLRKANHLAVGALVAAAKEKCATVSPEHVRIASTEIFA